MPQKDHQLALTICKTLVINRKISLCCEKFSNLYIVYIEIIFSDMFAVSEVSLDQTECYGDSLFPKFSWISVRYTWQVGVKMVWHMSQVFS